eukprot:729791-Pleurochrysis_carterae.AAC.1
MAMRFRSILFFTRFFVQQESRSTKVVPESAQPVYRSEKPASHINAAPEGERRAPVQAPAHERLSDETPSDASFTNEAGTQPLLPPARVDTCAQIRQIAESGVSR